MAATISQNLPRTFYKLAPKWACKVCDLGSRELALKKKLSSKEPIYKIAYMMAGMFASTENIAEQMCNLSSEVIFNSETGQMWIYEHRQSDSLPKSTADSQRLYHFVRVLVTKWFARDEANYLLEHSHITTCFFVWYFTTPDLFYKDNVIKQTTRNGIQRIWTPLILDKKPKKKSVQSVPKKDVKLATTTDPLLPKQQSQQAQLRQDIQDLIANSTSASIEWDDPLGVHLLVSECLAGGTHLSIKQTKKLQNRYNDYTKLTEKINKTLGKIRKVEAANAKLAPAAPPAPPTSNSASEPDKLGRMPDSPPELIRRNAECSGCATNQANQEAHIGGCLPDEDEDEVPDSWEDL
jgi:hypothetical protein